MTGSSYDTIAQEYYDTRHLTSRNFDNVTQLALTQQPFEVPDGLVLEIGAGRGRAIGFLGLDSARVVQLDSSEPMLALEDREESLLRIHADACNIPLASQQFGSVLGFLIDPFIGLASMAEAYRMLIGGGQLFFTVPTQQWGKNLRERLCIDVMTTRFNLISTNETIILPSLLYSKERIQEILEISGFKSIEIQDHCLPADADPISPDIATVCESLQIDHSRLPVIHTIRALR